MGKTGAFRTGFAESHRAQQGRYENFCFKKEKGERQKFREQVERLSKYPGLHKDNVHRQQCANAALGLFNGWSNSIQGFVDHNLILGNARNHCLDSVDTLHMKGAGSSFSSPLTGCRQWQTARHVAANTSSQLPARLLFLNTILSVAKPSDQGSIRGRESKQCRARALPTDREAQPLSHPLLLAVAPGNTTDLTNSMLNEAVVQRQSESVTAQTMQYSEPLSCFTPAQTGSNPLLTNNNCDDKGFGDHARLPPLSANCQMVRGSAAADSVSSAASSVHQENIQPLISPTVVTIGANAARDISGIIKNPLKYTLIFFGMAVTTKFIISLFDNMNDQPAAEPLISEDLPYPKAASLKSDSVLNPLDRANADIAQLLQEKHGTFEATSSRYESLLAASRYLLQENTSSSAEQQNRIMELARPVLAAYGFYGGDQSQIISAPQARSALADWYFSNIIGVQPELYVANNLKSGVIAHNATINRLAEVLSFNNVLSPSSLTNEPLSASDKQTLEGLYRLFLNEKFPFLKFSDHAVKNIELTSFEFADLFTGCRVLEDLSDQDYTIEQAKILGNNLWNELQVEAQRRKIQLEDNTNYYFTPVLFSLAELVSELSKNGLSDFNLTGINHFNAITIYTQDKKRVEDFQHKQAAFQHEAGKWLSKSMLADQIIDQCNLAEQQLLIPAISSIRGGIGPTSVKNYKQDYMNGYPLPCQAAPNSLEEVYKQQTSRVADNFHDVDKYLLELSLKAIPEDDYKFIFSNESTINIANAHIFHNNKDVLLYPRLTNTLVINLKATDLILIENNNLLKTYALKKIHKEYREIKLGDVLTAKETETDTSYPYQLILVNNDINKYIESGLISDDYQHHKIDLNNKEMVGKYLTLIIIDQQKVLPDNGTDNFDALVKKLQSKHRELFYKNLFDSGNDQSNLQKTWSIVKHLIPFYDCVTGIAESDIHDTLTSCTLDLFNVFPVVSQTGKISWKLVGAVKGAAWLTRSTPFLREANQGIKLSQLPNLSDIFLLSKDILRAFDPGLELTLEAGYGIIKLVRTLLSKDARTVQLSHKLKPALMPRYANSNTGKSVMALLPRTDIVVPVRGVGKENGLDVYARFNLETNEVFGKKYHLDDGMLVPLKKSSVIKKDTFPSTNLQQKGNVLTHSRTVKSGDVFDYEKYFREYPQRHLSNQERIRNCGRTFIRKHNNVAVDSLSDYLRHFYSDNRLLPSAQFEKFSQNLQKLLQAEGDAIPVVLDQVIQSKRPVTSSLELYNELPGRILFMVNKNGGSIDKVSNAVISMGNGIFLVNKADFFDAAAPLKITSMLQDSLGTFEDGMLIVKSAADAVPQKLALFSGYPLEYSLKSIDRLVEYEELTRKLSSQKLSPEIDSLLRYTKYPDSQVIKDIKSIQDTHYKSYMQIDNFLLGNGERINDKDLNSIVNKFQDRDAIIYIEKFTSSRKNYYFRYDSNHWKSLKDGRIITDEKVINLAMDSKYSVRLVNVINYNLDNLYQQYKFRLATDLLEKTDFITVSQKEDVLNILTGKSSTDVSLKLVEMQKINNMAIETATTFAQNPFLIRKRNGIVEDIHLLLNQQKDSLNFFSLYEKGGDGMGILKVEDIVSKAGKVDEFYTANFDLYNRRYKFILGKDSSLEFDQVKRELKVTAHGFYFSTAHYNAQELAEIISGWLKQMGMKLSDLKGIQLLSCSSATGGSCSQGGILASILRKPVTAYNSRISESISSGNAPAKVYNPDVNTSLMSLETRIWFNSHVNNFISDHGATLSQLKMMKYTISSKFTILNHLVRHPFVNSRRPRTLHADELIFAGAEERMNYAMYTLATAILADNSDINFTHLADRIKQLYPTSQVSAKKLQEYQSNIYKDAKKLCDLEPGVPEQDIENYKIFSIFSLFDDMNLQQKDISFTQSSDDNSTDSMADGRLNLFSGRVVEFPTAVMVADLPLARYPGTGYLDNILNTIHVTKFMRFVNSSRLLSGNLPPSLTFQELFIMFYAISFPEREVPVSIAEIGSVYSSNQSKRQADKKVLATNPHVKRFITTVLSEAMQQHAIQTNSTMKPDTTEQPDHPSPSAAAKADSFLESREKHDILSVPLSLPSVYHFINRLLKKVIHSAKGYTAHD